MAEFQDLEIRLQAVDNASKTLEKVVGLLEKLKSLTGGDSGNTTSNTTNSTKAQVQAIKNVSSANQKAAQTTQVLVDKEKLLADITRGVTSSREGATNAEISLNKARNTASANAQKYAEKEQAVTDALERQAAAQAALSSAMSQQSKFNSIADLLQQGKGKTISSADTSWFWQNQNTDFAKQVADAQKELDKANKDVASSTQSARNAYVQYINSLDSVKSATNRVGQEQERLEKRNQNTARSFVTLAAKITTVIRVFRRLTQGLFSAIKESGEFVENLNLFAVTFGENYQETLNWALEFADNLGVASNEIVRFTGLFKQLADSIGVTQETATEMSQVLTQLGYDLASFYNITTESAFEKLQAGIFSGQTKPLRSLGLDVTQQTLDNLLKTDEAFKDLGVTSSKALLQSDKAMLRLIVVLQNAQNSFGDINRTINTLSNQLRVFESSLSNLRLAIGDLFAEPFRNALIYINAFLIAITKIIRAFKPIATESETAGAGMQQFADDVEEATDASTGGGNLDFDEFRVLSSGENEQVSITEVITAELQKQIDAYNEQIKAMNEVSNKAVEIAEKIKDWFIVTDEESGEFVDLTGKAKLLLATLTAIATIFTLGKIGTIGATEGNFFQKISFAIMECATSTKGLTSQVTLLGKAFTFLQTNPIVLAIAAIVAVLAILYTQNEAFRESVNKLFQSLSPLFELLGNLLGSILEPIGQLLGLIGNILAAILIPIIDKITVALNTVMLALIPIAYLLEAIIKLCQSAVQALVDVFTFNWANFGKNQKEIWSNWDSNAFAQSTFDNLKNSFKLYGYADGGITDANFIMTHENGVREWVGRQGNSTAVVNDTQMSDVMGTAVRNGVLEALSYNTGNGETFNITVQANLDGQKVYESTKRIARRNGEKFARV